MLGRQVMAVAVSALTLTAVASGLTIQAAAGAPSDIQSSENQLVGSAVTAAALATASAEPETLARARTIRAQLDARYRLVPSRGLAVTEASTTGVVESFTLVTSDLLGVRIVAADNGLYFAVCLVRAACPYPAHRLARPAAGFLPRRLALELALRAFLETSATVVAVSLPTPRFLLFVVERHELTHEVDMPALAQALGGDPAPAPTAWLRQTVDQITRPRVFVVLGLEPTPSGRDTLAAIPRWPTASAASTDNQRPQPAARPSRRTDGSLPSSLRPAPAPTTFPPA